MTRARNANSVKTRKAQSDSASLILSYLYIGPCAATSATSVARQGITHIISVGKTPRSTLDSVTYLRLSIEDDPSADLRKAGREAVAFIDTARAGKKSCKILVHCAAGISRSPSIVAFYLMQSGGMSLKQALGLIVRARPQACPNDGFVSQLQQAEWECRGSSSLPPNLTSLPRKKEDRLALFRVDRPGDTSSISDSASFFFSRLSGTSDDRVSSLLESSRGNCMFMARSCRVLSAESDLLNRPNCL